MYALLGGAVSVDSVDSSKPSLNILEQNIRLNGELKGTHRTHCQDCFEFLGQNEKKYDVIIVDPPAFVKHRKSIDAGLRAYQSLNEQAMTHLRPSGLLLTFSCSQLVTAEMFTQMLQRACVRKQKEPQLVSKFTQSPCHTQKLQHPEGTYLKGAALWFY